LRTRLTDLERQRIRIALVEDSGKGDPTTEATVPADAIGKGTFLIKQNGILAGIDYARHTFEIYETQTNVNAPIFEYSELIEDGSSVQNGDVAAEIKGNLRTLLTAERVALNLLQRMSGIATLTHEFVEQVTGTGAIILDTRKTAPLLRPFDRYAVRAGGGTNHRYGLSDMVLVKDNHIAAAGGSIALVLERLLEYFAIEGHPRIPIEVEVTTILQLEELILLGKGLVQRVLLDNFVIEQLRDAVSIVGEVFETEASGGVTLDTVRAIAETGVNFISVGALTHSVKALDISLEIEEM
jgi:nicotinate-nucleotide pyrophosphorylase (carboxylating)